MRVAIYARVSTESQEARGTIGSQHSRSCASGLPRKDTSSLPSTAMTVARALGWTDPVSMHCEMPPKRGGLTPSGVCPQIAWPGCMPIRSS